MRAVAFELVTIGARSDNNDCWLFVPHVNNVDLLRQALDSVRDVNCHLWVLDSSKDGLPPDAEFLAGCSVVRLDYHTTFCQMQNAILKRAWLADVRFVIFMHSDAQVLDASVVPELLAAMEPDTGVAFTNYDAMACFNMACVKDVGFWDESYAWYASDCDYYHRIRQRGWKLKHTALQDRVAHVVSATLKTGDEARASAGDGWGDAHHAHKWGGGCNAEVYERPYNVAATAEHVTDENMAIVPEFRDVADEIVAALKARGHGTLCFHGPPGTGKTALAHHIARHLDRPLMIRQASDLMSKFVGETEQRMAAMFREAEAEQRGWDAVSQLEAMDREGLDVAVLFPRSDKISSSGRILSATSWARWASEPVGAGMRQMAVCSSRVSASAARRISRARFRAGRSARPAACSPGRTSTGCSSARCSSSAELTGPARVRQTAAQGLPATSLRMASTSFGSVAPSVLVRALMRPSVSSRTACTITPASGSSRPRAASSSVETVSAAEPPRLTWRTTVSARTVPTGATSIRRADSG